MRRRSLMSGKGGSRLPKGYKEVEWIGLINNRNFDARIDTELYDTAGEYLYEADVIISEEALLTQSENYLFGCGRLGGFSQFVMCINGGFKVSSGWNMLTVDMPVIANTIYHIEFTNGYIKINDTIAFPKKNEGSSSMPISVFGSYMYPSYNCIVKSFKLYNNIMKDVLLLDYIPCISPDGFKGFYDLVSQEFVTKNNGSYYIAGDPV